MNSLVNSKFKLVTVVGTRPEIIRLSSCIRVFDELFDHKLVHTGQNFDYTLNGIFFDELGVRKPDFFLNSARETAVKTISVLLSAAEDILIDLRPDALFVLGDTNSGLIVYVAKRLKIPVFHYEAGNRCFDQRVPEEINRLVIDNLSDINLTYSGIARDVLIGEGFKPDRVINVGSPLFEVLNEHRSSIENSDVLSRFSLESKKFLVLSCHREDNVDNPIRLQKLFSSMVDVFERFKYPVIFPMHPRTRKKLSEHAVSVPDFVSVVEPLGFFDYNCLQINSFAVLSDSGSVSEEAAILGFNAINLRQVHERHEASEQSQVIMTGFESSNIISALDVFTIYDNCKFDCPEDYKQSNVSHKIARIILSYTDYINRNVWKRYSIG